MGEDHQSEVHVNASEGSEYLPLSVVQFFEQSFDPDMMRSWSNEIKSSSLLCSFIYVVLVFTGQWLMKNRPAFNLRMPLIAWNIGLAVFSIVGAIRTIPELVDSVLFNGFVHSICNSRFFYGTTGFWAYAFTASKVIELGDTAFIVLRRQPLIFLHWYHHVTVLIYCFYSYPEHVSSGRWYMVMNYCVHSVMYSYFALRALRFRVPAVIRKSVTLLQITQMIIGLGIVVGAYIVKSQGTNCQQSYNNMAITIAMYASYLILFLHFFYCEYTMSAKPLGPSSASAVNGKKAN
jgi:elongation of very long chain fatty acids protein 6